MFLLAPLFVVVLGLFPLSAAVIYTPVSFQHSLPTGALPGATIFTFDLPGLNDLNVITFSYSGSVPVSNFYQLNTVNDGQSGIASEILSGLYFIKPLNVGEVWNDSQTVTLNGANIDRMPQAGGPSVYPRSNPTYVPFWFYDTTDSNQKKFGYATISTGVTGSGASSQFNLDIFGYAYESVADTKIAMGAVPEPSTALSALLGIFGTGVVVLRRRSTNARRFQPAGEAPV